MPLKNNLGINIKFLNYKKNNCFLTKHATYIIRTIHFFCFKIYIISYYCRKKNVLIQENVKTYIGGKRLVYALEIIF